MKKWQVGWGVTNECNLKCQFCYSGAVRKQVDTLTFKDWKKFIDLNHNNIKSINYGTGENTISKEWFELIDYIRTNYPEISQALTTNGYLSQAIKKSPKFYSIILKSIDEIDVSLDFIDRTRQAEFRGHKDVYDWELDTLKFCKDNKLETTIVFIGINDTLKTSNLDSIFDLGDYYNAKIRMNIYRQTNKDPEVNKRFTASYDNILNALYHINDKYYILSLSDPLFNSILNESKYIEDPSGVSSIRILPDGSITPSTYLITEEFRAANIKTIGSLDSICGTESFRKIRDRCIPAKCINCKYEIRCKGGVIDRRLLWYKNINERDPYCPFREENYVPHKKVTIREDVKFNSVHDGYLPTLFFVKDINKFITETKSGNMNKSV